MKTGITVRTFAVPHRYGRPKKFLQDFFLAYFMSKLNKMVSEYFQKYNYAFLNIKYSKTLKVHIWLTTGVAKISKKNYLNCLALEAGQLRQARRPGGNLACAVKQP